MPSPADTAEAFRAAVRRGDAAGVAALTAPDVIVNGPVSMRMRFDGPDQVHELFGVMLANVDEVHYVEEVGAGDTRVLTLQGRRGRIRYEEAVLMRVGQDGLITELCVYVRPLPGMIAMAAAFAPALARARGQRVRAVFLTLMLIPVREILVRGEALGARLLRR